MNTETLENKKPTKNFDLKSEILDWAGVVFNAIGAFILTFGYLDHLSASTTYIGWAMFLLGGALVVYSKSYKRLAHVSRIIVGGIFIASGLIKANDPEGFSYKLLEYFEEGALNLVWLNDYALFLSILVCIAEIVLGFAVVLGTKIKLASWALVILTLFFGWLTYYTATCDVHGTYTSAKEIPVEQFTDTQRSDFESDSTKVIVKEDAKFVYVETQEPNQCVETCGCFGDAFKGSIGRSLKPWESFGKDAILFYFVLIIFLMQWRIKINTKLEDKILIGGSLAVVTALCFVFSSWFFPLIFSLIVFGGSLFFKYKKIGGKQYVWIMALFVILASTIFSVYCYSYLPIKDYRAYAVGNNIIEKMNDGEDGVYEETLVYKNLKTKEEKSLSQAQFTKNWEEYMDTSKYVFVRKDQKVIKETKIASIVDFAPNKSFHLLSESILNDISFKPTLDSLSSEYIKVYHLFKERTYGYIDSVEVDEAYDPSYYPDSTYEDLGEVKKVLNNEFSVDLTKYLLSRDYVFLLVARQLEESNLSNIDAVNELANACKVNGIPFYGLSASFQEEIDAFKEKTGAEFDFLTADDTELKIIVRSNPGLILLHQATVLDKWSFRTIPSFEDVKSQLGK